MSGDLTRMASYMTGGEIMNGMERRWRATGASLLFVVTIGCAGTTVGQPQPVEFVDPLLGLLNKGIGQLDVNINRAAKRLEELKQFPDTQDRVLQRNHLHFAKSQVLASKQNLADKARLLQEWTSHEQQYRQDMDAFRQKRLDLEHKRLTVEGQLIARSIM